MSNNEPKTIRELYFYCKGEFEILQVEIKNMRKITFWIGGLTGGIISAVIAGLFKIFGGK